MPRRILVLGCGGVAQCTLPLLVHDVGVDPHSITVVDFVDNRHRIADLIALGVNWENGRVTQENIDEFLSARLSDGDMLLDLAWNIDAPTILTWCHDHNVRYLNTSVELWDPYEDMASTSPTDRTLYVRHQSLTKMINDWGGNGGATAVLEHGANPGLVSHFVKQALAEITTKILTEGRAGNRQAALETALAQGEFNTLSMLTGTKVIHIAERDTQITNTPKQVNEFVNTWSVDGFYEEGIAPAELGWGTHERTLPPRAYTHNDDGPRNQICIAQPGMNTWVRTWVPSGESHGMVIRHGEAYTMCKHLTVKNADGTDAYRPTVHYAYCPPNEAIASVHELKMRDWEMQPKQRLLNDDIISGRDELGVLLLGHDFTGWWTGSLLSIDEARKVLPHQSATTLQVAASIVSAIQWMFVSPSSGVCVPDDLPHEFILEKAKPYLGTQFSGPTDWNPLRTRKDIFDQWADHAALLDPSDPWQFGNFLVS
ncbi:MAG: saccharopine dehydrogenase NADP-binding domain-containing protein [Actinobacteria bacterium]|nr:saccharopine dehydrogenase NADP-binding domain-containing protein [Actinomycetota bacterium]